MSTPLDAKLIPKFVTQLQKPPVYKPKKLKNPETREKCLGEIPGILKKTAKKFPKKFRTKKIIRLRILKLFALFRDSFLPDPVGRYRAVLGIDLDSDPIPVVKRSSNKCRAAPHERIEHRVAREREKFHAPHRKLDGERGRVPDPGLALAVEGPESVCPFHELLFCDIGRTRAARLLP